MKLYLVDQFYWKRSSAMKFQYTDYWINRIYFFYCI